MGHRDNRLFIESSDNVDSDLPAAIRESEVSRKQPQPWPSSDRGDDFSGRGLAGVMDEEMGFVD